MKLITKKKLIELNGKAIEAEANALDPNYLAGIPNNYKFPVDRILPFPERRGWVRCCVGIGTSWPPVLGGNFQSVVMDLPEEEFEKLPVYEEA